MFHLLVAPEMEPVPKNIEIVEDYGLVTLFHGVSGMYSSGLHLVIQAEPQVVKEWLGRFEGVWVGKGQPYEQRFEVCHIDLND